MLKPPGQGSDDRSRYILHIHGGWNCELLMSRIREKWLQTHNNRQAVARGLEKTGSVITSAALLFMVVTVSFTFTSVIDTKEVGVGMTIAVLVDTTIIRSLLVPATMRLLGRWNWWLPGSPVQKESVLP
jgi:RND superfamily putative drug exporter